jgi:peptidoglycan/LPS O-acetylase OafA/YrhL
MDGVRGLAVLLVLTFHFLFGSQDISANALSGDILRKLSYVGWTGVDLFFVLSGFLITRILLNARSQKGYFRNFYARRVLRIFPLYYMTLLFFLVVLPIFSTARQQEVAEQGSDQVYLWTYTLNIATMFKPGYLKSMDFGHFWSLCVEEHFYFFWPLLVWLLGSRGIRRMCPVLVVAAIACRTGLRLAGVHSTPIFYFTPCRIDSLAMGAWVATYAVDHAGAQRSLPESWRPRAILIGAMALAAMTVVLVADRGGCEAASGVSALASR